MKLQVTYKDTNDGVEQKWTADIVTDPDEFTTILTCLMTDADNAKQNITRVVIDPVSV